MTTMTTLKSAEDFSIAVRRWFHENEKSQMSLVRMAKPGRTFSAATLSLIKSETSRYHPSVDIAARIAEAMGKRLVLLNEEEENDDDA